MWKIHNLALIARLMQEMLILSHFQSSKWYVSIELPPKLWFLLKMSGHSTSYNNQFRIYGDSKKYPKFHQLFRKMTSSLPVIWKNVDVSKMTIHKEYIHSKIRKKYSLLKICTMINVFRSFSPLFSLTTAWKVSIFRVFLVFIFLHSDWIQYQYSVFSQNAGKYGPEKVWMETLFTQWIAFINFTCKVFWGRSGYNIIVFKSVNYFWKILIVDVWLNSDSDISFLKFTLAYVDVFMCVYI